jgi:diguanylate cyclase (GGDEF)-like protein
VVAISAIGLLDWGTGTELRIHPLYFLPLCAHAWQGRPTSTFLLVGLCAMIWAGSNYLAGLRFSHGAFWAANVLTQALAFATVTALVSWLGALWRREHQLSRTDSLTGLLNSRGFYERAQPKLDRARRSGASLTLAYIDLDNFNLVNARAGHAAGDAALAQFGKFLRSALRPTDIAARVGGDEFAVLLPDTGIDAARTVLQHLRASYAASTLGVPAAVTASIGAVSFAVAPPAIDKAIGWANGVMSEVKRSGRNSTLIVLDSGNTADTSRQRITRLR